MFGSFCADHLFVTLESKKTIKIHNLPPPNAHDKSYQNHSVIKAVRRQVVGLWPGGSKEDVEERGEWWVKLGGEGNAWGADGNGSEGVTYAYCICTRTLRLTCAFFAGPGGWSRSCSKSLLRRVIPTSAPCIHPVPSNPLAMSSRLLRPRLTRTSSYSHSPSTAGKSA
jgi:hypothetical protein